MSSFVVETCIPLSTACSLPICLHMVFAIPFHKLSSYIVFIAFGISGVHYCDPAGPIHRLRRRPRMLKKNAKKKHLRPTSREVERVSSGRQFFLFGADFCLFFKLKTQPKTHQLKKNISHLQKKKHHKNLVVVFFQHVKKNKPRGFHFLFR